MFSALGLFRDIKCPQVDCVLPNCLFSHDKLQKQDVIEKVCDPVSSQHIEVHPAKRRKIEHLAKSISGGQTGGVDVTGQNGSKGSEPTTRVVSQFIAERDDKVKSKPAPARPVSATRPISPPPLTSKQVSISKGTAKTLRKAEVLVPRTLQRDPVPFPQRVKILQKLHAQLSELNLKFQKEDTGSPGSKLDEQELIKISLKEEQKAAESCPSPDGYKNALAQRLSFYRKLDLAHWRELVTSERDQSKPQELSEINEKPLTTLSREKDLAMLPHLQTSINGLETFGYTTSIPLTKDVVEAEKAHLATAGWEMCDRCGTRFQVFPGRNVEGLLTSRGRCTYHWARIQRRKDVGEAVYPCCGQSAGSEGCETCATHVFKVNDTKLLASILQFETTPPNGILPKYPAVTFDCEMGYTTLGMELVRVTAITWPDKKDLLDVLVRPYGEVLDFNTRFSGVDADIFATTLPFQKQSIQGQGGYMDSLRKVESVAEARSLLFNLISPDTVLIGHAIENDLNTCRIIHPKIIDTVLLFPHPRGLPIRYKLRDLSAKYLKRHIQAAGDGGHDSKEDSRATGDLVRIKAEEMFKSLMQSGYSWKDEKLTQNARI